MYPLRRVGGACDDAVYGEYKVRLWERKGRLHFLDAIDYIFEKIEELDKEEK